MKRSVRLAVLTILIVVAIVAALPFMLTVYGRSLFNGQNYGGAQSTWRVASYLSFYDRDAILFDIATAIYWQRQYERAAAQFAAASAIGSDKHFCKITYNWGLTLRDWGDDLASGDKPKALLTYSDALRVIAVARCNEDPRYKDVFEELRQDLLQKIANLTRAEDTTQQQSEESKQSSSDKQQEILQDNSQEQKQQRSYEKAKTYYRNSSPASNFKVVW